MATNDSQLKDEVRLFTNYDVTILNEPDLDTVIRRAKKHIRTRKDITDSSFDWYADDYREEVVFWYTCLFAKVATGELDSGDIQVGAIDIGSLLAQDDDEVTTWFRNAKSALQTLDAGGDNPYGHGITSPARDDRSYGGDDSADLGF